MARKRRKPKGLLIYQGIYDGDSVLDDPEWLSLAVCVYDEDGIFLDMRAATETDLLAGGFVPRDIAVNMAKALLAFEDKRHDLSPKENWRRGEQYRTAVEMAQHLVKMFATGAQQESTR